jgi:Tfp pilus assembly protein PilF
LHLFDLLPLRGKCSLRDVLVCVQVWVNLGAMFLARQEPDEAQRMFSAALQRFYNKQDHEVLLYLARAQYDMKDVKSAKRTLLKALHICPQDQRLLFNAGVCMQNYVSQVRATSCALQQQLRHAVVRQACKFCSQRLPMLYMHAPNRPVSLC